MEMHAIDSLAKLKQFRYPYFLGHGSTSNKLLLTRITTHNISKDMIVVHLDQLANLRGSFLLFLIPTCV